MAVPAVRLTPFILAAAFGGLTLLPFLGYVDFGHVVFYGIGAYATAVTLASSHPAAIPLGALIVPGALAAIVFGVLVGYPTLRLRGAYFAIANFSINEAVLAIVLNVDALGGSDGFPLARYVRLELIDVYYVLLAVTVILAGASYGILRTRVGLALLAI